MLGEAIKLAMQAIRRNALRSFLTVLGVVIGVAAVIAMVTVGNGTAARVQADLAKLGKNMLFVMPGQFGPGRASASARAFSVLDVEAMATQVPNVAAVAPVVQKSVTQVFGNESRTGTVTGTETSFFQIQEWTIVEGRVFNDTEVRAANAVCVIGNTVRTKLLGSEPVLGARIRLNKISCEVIGLLGAKGQNSMGMDQDDVILMPLRTLQRRIVGTTDIGTMLVSAGDGVNTDTVQRDIERLLRERRHIQRGTDDDFSVMDMKQLAQTQAGTMALLTGLLGAVAAVSLLVGGIGIMNIMLVSVTERTREIGIRLAIGALEGQVLTQFLVEAVVLSLFGGLTGILLGLGLAYAATSGLGVPFVVSPGLVAVAFGFSALIGVVFGFFPARRAAHLNPIDALRHE
ncbi:MAG: ABC transporter permease [Hyphomicrobiaceae bacterium]|nr:ABC transporter permease [Hyphomicrobiaceae bacterium]